MWVRLDDKMPDDPDIDVLSDGAFRLYVASMCFCAKYLTDGYVAADRVTRLLPRFRPSYVAELVTHGLWLDDLPGGYTLRSYVKYNGSRADWERRKAEAQARKDKWKATRDASRSTS